MTASASVHSEPSRPTAATPLRRVPVQGRSMARVQRMLDACAAIVDEVGYDGLTTTLLAERAGVAIGSVYQFFPDKRAVVRALAQRHLATYLECLGHRLAAYQERLDHRRAGGVAGWWEPVAIAIDEYIRMHRAVPAFRVLRLADLLDDLAIASRIAEALVRSAGAADIPRLRFTLTVALEAVGAVITSAFRQDPHGDEAVLAQATVLARGYLHAAHVGATARA